MVNKNVYLGILASIFVGTGVVFASQLAKSLSPILALSFCYILSLPFLLLLSYINREKIQFNRVIFKNKNLWKIILGRSILGSLILIFGFKLTSPINSLFLLRTEPFFVVIASYFLLKQKINFRQFLMMLLMAVGAFIFVTSFNFNVFTSVYLGDILIILAMAILSYTYVATFNMMKSANSMTITFLSNLVAGVVLLPAVLFIPFKFTQDVIFFLTGYTLLFYVFGLYFFFKSLVHLKPWIVSSLLTLELIAGSTLAFFWLKDTINSTQLFGGIIILLASYFISGEA